MKKIWWIVVIIVIATFGVLLLLVLKEKSENKNGNGKYYTDNGLPATDKTKFEVFPVKLEDFVVPPKMYGLWPYGVKGKDSSDHNEGHPGWDFELKKGSKIYAIGDVYIDQIHEGDKSTEGQNFQVIEAASMLGSDRYHIVYHSVTNLEPDVKAGATIKAGEILAEVGFPLSSDSAMIHFGIFSPHDSVGSCPSDYFSASLQEMISKIVVNSNNMATGKPFESACIGKISKELYLQNYPDREKDLGGAEPWE